MRLIAPAGIARGKNRRDKLRHMTRPTLDKVKQAIFNSLQMRVEGAAVLDLFAGSGALGLEALSRGAACAVFADSDPAAIEAINANLDKTGLAADAHVFRTDFRQIKRQLEGKNLPPRFDIIFLDPPYESDFIDEAVRLIKSENMLAKHGVIVCESKKAADKNFAAERLGFTLEFERGYGSVVVRIYGC
ncbi:MAG: 16S rRNA (guanine(966)-N(2))-methyltransferase RsmD [Clostridiales bacterium]|nr:16S rRNA (guanine(966)-N(2))-methyltransferase RsmD [Clostridiales bacterium]